jgi:hypothetical protein
MPCTTPTGKNNADTTSKGRIPLAEQKTIDVSHAA